MVSGLFFSTSRASWLSLRLYTRSGMPRAWFKARRHSAQDSWRWQIWCAPACKVPALLHLPRDCGLQWKRLVLCQHLNPCIQMSRKRSFPVPELALTHLIRATSHYSAPLISSDIKRRSQGRQRWFCKNFGWKRMHCNKLYCGLGFLSIRERGQRYSRGLTA